MASKRLSYEIHGTPCRDCPALGWVMGCINRPPSKHLSTKSTVMSGIHHRTRAMLKGSGRTGYAPLPAEISTHDWAVSCTVAAQIDVSMPPSNGLTI